MKVPAALAAAVLLVGLALPGVSLAQVRFSQGGFSAYATGTVGYAALLETGGVAVQNTDVAFSGAAANAGGLQGVRNNEMGRPYVADLGAGKNSYARGSGLEVRAAVIPGSPTEAIVAGLAETDAPPDSGPVTEQVGPVPASPAAFASVLRGQAQANWGEDDTCVLGADLSRGLGYASDVELIDTAANDGTEDLDAPLLALDADDPERSVSQSMSRTRLVRQVNAQGQVIGQNWGIMGETRQTIAPVTVAAGTPNERTIEFLGEWVLQAVAGGLPGGGFVHYGPGQATPSTPILRLIDAAGAVTDIVEFQDITGPTGVVLPLPSGGEIAIGEDPRAIGGDASTSPTIAANGTSASAAVDVARIILPGGVLQTRVGHMEVSAQVPAGGISCSVPVDKSADPETVRVGETFRTPITVNNPFDCDLVNVRVTDDITTTGGARFRVEGTDPQANSAPTDGNLSEGTVVWNDIGPIARGQSRTVTVTIRAQAGGRIEDIATANATLANCEDEGGAVAGSAAAFEGAAIAGASLPVRVTVAEVAPLVLPRTGPTAQSAALGGFVLLGLASLGWLVSRRTS